MKRSTASAFHKQLKLALKWYDDPVRLANASPLASAYFLGAALEGSTDANQRGEALRASLRLAANALWDGPLPSSRESMQQALADIRQQPGSRSYAFVVLDLRTFKHFFQPRKLADIWESDHLLPGSRAEHYRDFDRAVELLGVQLLQQVRPPVRLERTRPPALLLGYEQPLAVATEALAAGKTVLLVGAGGIGKSALGATIAEQQTRPVFWYTTQPALTDHPSALLYALGYFLHEQGASGLWSLVLAQNGQFDDLNLVLGLIREDIEQLPTPPLLCFDDLEHLRDTFSERASPVHTQLLRVLDALRGTAPLLLLSQRPVIEAEVTLGLSGLGPLQIERLWQEAGQAIAHGEVARLFDYTGGNPRLLLLCLALYQKGVGLDALDADPRTSPLRTALNRLWPRLEPGERRVLQALSVYRAAAPESGLADGLVEESKASGPENGTSLAAPLRMRLVQRDGQGGVALLPAFRELIAAELSPSLREQLHLRAAGTFLVVGEHTAAAHHFARAGHDDKAIQVWFPHREQEIGRGQSAVAATIFENVSSGRLRRQERNALHLIRAELQQLEGRAAEGLAELEVGDWAADSGLTLRARVLRADFLEATGDPERALQSYREAEALTNRLLGQLSTVHRQQGLLHLRRADHQAARREARRAGYEANYLLGVTYSQEGRYDDALAAYQAALALAEQLGDESRIARLHRYLSILHARQQNFERSSHHAERSIDYYERVGDRLNQAGVRNNLCGTYLYAKQYEQAIAVGVEALAFFRRIEHGYFIAAVASNLAEAYWALGNKQNAQRYAQESAAQEEPQFIPYALHTLSLIQQHQGKPAAAETLLREAAALAQQNEDPFMEAYAERTLGQLLRDRGESSQAHLQRALALFQRLGVDAEIAETEALLS